MLSTCIPFSHSRPNSLLCYLKPQITWQAVNTMSHTTNSLGISSCYSTWMLASWLFCKKKQNGLFLARESVLIFEKVLQHWFAFHVAPFPSPRDRSQSWVSSREGTSFSGDWSGELIQKERPHWMWTKMFPVWCWHDRQVLSSFQEKPVSQSNMALIYNTKSAFLPGIGSFFFSKWIYDDPRHSAAIRV